MKLPAVDLLEALRKERERCGEDVMLSAVQSVLRAAEAADRDLLRRVAAAGSQPVPVRVPDDGQVFPLEAIRRTCIAFRLRFLPSSRFRAPVPYEALVRIRELERASDTRIEEFYILAPAPAFHLEKKTDPLLFVPAGEDRFLLVHRWGGELSPLRKVLSLPLRNLRSLLVTVIVCAFLLAAAVPSSWLAWNEELSHRTYSVRMYIFFLLVLGSVFAGLLMHIRKNTNVSEDNWDSHLF
jgi:hypothetical protein